MSKSSEEVRKSYENFVFPSLIKYYKEPLVLARAKGSRVWDAEGREYLDFFAGILTTSLGHCHEGVNRAVEEQQRTLGHTSSLYLNERTAQLAETMARITPGRLRKSFFTCSGTEADETAVLAARHFTGRSDVIALRHGYSGRSSLAMSLTGMSNWRLGGSTQPGVVRAVAPYCYRCPLKLEPETCGMACAEDLDELIRTSTSGGPAALIAEPVTGVSGFITPPKEWFKVAVDIVRRHGGVFICDEVQSGWGRTGEWFAISHYGVEPEILTTAKAVGNGYPLGVTIAVPEVADALKGLHISTFGGSPPQAAAALAVIDEFERSSLPSRAAELGEMIRTTLDGLVERHGQVDDSRGLGMMRAVEIVKDKKSREPDATTCNQIFEAARERGLLVGKAGMYGNCFRIAPPLTITREDLEEGLDRLRLAFADVLRD